MIVCVVHAWPVCIFSRRRDRDVPRPIKYIRLYSLFALRSWRFEEYVARAHGYERLKGTRKGGKLLHNNKAVQWVFLLLIFRLVGVLPYCFNIE